MLFIDVHRHERERWDVISVRMRFQQRDRLVVETRAVINGVHAGADGGLDALRAVRVRRHIPAPTRCFNDRRANFFIRVLLGTRHDTLGENRPGRQDLDEVRAILEVGANGLGNLQRTVGQIVNQWDLDVRRELQGIARTTGR